MTTPQHQILDAIITQAAPQLNSISLEEFAFKENPGKWSKQEILGHLIDSAYNNHRRFLIATYQDSLVFDGYQQDNWVQLNGYQKRDHNEIIFTWVSANQHLSFLLESIPEEIIFKETTDHNFHVIGMKRPEEGTLSSLGYLIWDYLFHMEHHLAQILPNYVKSNPTAYLGKID